MSDKAFAKYRLIAVVRSYEFICEFATGKAAFEALDLLDNEPGFGHRIVALQGFDHEVGQWVTA
ncbi:hypothetical protein [Williamsia phyllosphaerae]|uniref:Uncharacterized protein n=1 Tax=Williamsia phyllosphaerae TaxID=885042 RepID=A0ABQ1V523_9NOCA|nr:hypothetical protein [Williamsia phyllosphaerae]GGF38812.1 hypothetical protein GCM10007298_38150 [Williamsia phyllosphaerae]